MMLTIQKRPQVGLDKLATMNELTIMDALFGFIDTASTATARATFYNTKKEQREALEVVHDYLFEVERSLYTAALMLPGINDYSKQIGVQKLLLNKRDELEILTNAQEKAVIEKIIRSMPVHRMLNLFVMCRDQRINNARTRKIILRTILNSRNLELWSVRYRRKMAIVLEHALGKRMTGIVRAILSKSERTPQEANILRHQITKYLKRQDKADRVLECVGFVLGNREGLTLPLLKAFVDARTDIRKGKRLPYEVLEGIRGRFFKDQLTSAKVLELTAENLTKTQRMVLQSTAKAKGVQVEMNPINYDAVKLYIYAYNQGMTDEIRTALNEKARQAAKKLPVNFGHLGILVDGSESMRGNETQALRPIATACATRDMLRAASEYTTIHYAGGVADELGLVQVQGDTTLAEGLIELLEKGVDAVFIITDGYENAPAGRVAEVIRLARQIGIDTPIFQASPVMAAEAGGLRTLSESVMSLPISQPEAMSLGMLKAQMELDVQKGVLRLFEMTIPKIQ